MNIDWAPVIGGALGGIAFAVAAGFGTWLWVRLSARIRRKPMFIIRRTKYGTYEIEKTKRGIARNLRFTTGGNGRNTSPGSMLETLDDFSPQKKGDRTALSIEPDRPVDEFHVAWDEGHARYGSADLIDGEAQIFATKKPRGSWVQRFR